MLKMRYTLHIIKSDFNNFESKELMTYCIAIFTYKTTAQKLFNIYENLLKVVMSYDFIQEKYTTQMFLKASSTNKTTNNILYNNLYINKRFQCYHTTKSFI
jgi:hypothetical protein